MFRGAPNPYDEIVIKATDEQQTSENWEVIISLCDKVIDEGENGARNVIAAILKRLAHRTSNVQLYALSLAEALQKNCTVELHREMASKSFTQGLEKLISDRNTHDKVRKRALALVKQWSESFESDPTLGVMNECYENLRVKGYKFEGVVEPPPPDADDALLRQEEEELQRVLEMSKTDKGGRGHWVDYSGNFGASSSSAGPSGSGGGAGPSGSGSGSRTHYPSGYKPSPNPALSAEHQNARPSPPPSAAPAPAPAAATPAPAPAAPQAPPPASRVRALHKFEATGPSELAFEKGDIIKVVNREHKDWWRGQLRGKTGIFPVNYVDPIPEPTEEQLIKEAQAEAAIFAQAASIDRLLEMLKAVDPLKDNLADNEEIQELYRSSMMLRPKIVKMIDVYTRKKSDLLSMNDSFLKARKAYDQVMEESLAKYNPGGTFTFGTFTSPLAHSLRSCSFGAGLYPPHGWSHAGTSGRSTGSIRVEPCHLWWTAVHPTAAESVPATAASAAATSATTAV
ncbi:hypothetical protein DL93DRAFT_2063140 [Clavulina sp. PMI_390]|nr:hypothetical protein DL93DRAFT_2063140 [Clavulina sp. PMI_390]